MLYIYNLILIKFINIKKIKKNYILASLISLEKDIRIIIN